MIRTAAATILLICTTACIAPAKEVALPAKCSQCILVLTDSWSASRGTLAAFDRNGTLGWREHGSGTPVVIGNAGLAWGRGVIEVAELPGPVKLEGDNKAPAGVFRLSSVFGRARRAGLTKMPYLHLSTDIVAVNDSRSRYYNQLVDVTNIRDRDWRTAENMILKDNRYNWGVLVEHNRPPQPGAGSCIFLHVWKNRSTLTTGCTAMPQEKLLELIRWLDPSRDPLLVQLPRPLYNELRTKWKLPPPQ